jgi:hypothetical protein
VNAFRLDAMPKARQDNTSIPVLRRLNKSPSQQVNPVCLALQKRSPALMAIGLPFHKRSSIKDNK